jgi:hypothetical protein
MQYVLKKLILKCFLFMGIKNLFYSGIHARPAFPLTPAAVINGHVMSREEMSRREEEEEIQRIRSNIRGGAKSETVSTALLNALMPYVLYSIRFYTTVHTTKARLG